MAGFTLLSLAGYAPDFVRNSALKGWALPPDVKIQTTGQVLSALRRVAAGEPVAVLLDQTQAAALPSLPFAAELRTVTQSPELPVAIVVVVDSRLPAARAHSLQQGLLKMGQVPRAADSLAPLHLHGFVLPMVPADTALP
jgi:ABC-type phosphate/phosphonate transport system substrate-binding protein